MSAHRLWLKQIAKLGLLLMMEVSMSACAGFLGFGGTSWKEEVLLHDGSKIIVERTVERGGGQKPPYKNQSLSFTLPNTNEKIKWKDNFTEDVGSANFLPMLVDIFNGSAYLVASPMGCQSYNKWGRPNPPYAVFKYEGKAWNRIPLQELPAEIKTPNMIFSMQDIKVEEIGKSLVTAEMIQRIISEYKQPEFKTILREAIPNASGGCSEMIHVNDGWERLGFFRLQPSYQACLKYCDKKSVSQQNCPCNKLFKGEK